MGRTQSVTYKPGWLPPQLQLPALGPLPGVVKSLDSGMIPGLTSLFHHLAAKIYLSFRIFSYKMRLIIIAPPPSPPAVTWEWVHVGKITARSWILKNHHGYYYWFNFSAAHFSYLWKGTHTDCPSSCPQASARQQPQKLCKHTALLSTTLISENLSPRTMGGSLRKPLPHSRYFIKQAAVKFLVCVCSGQTKAEPWRASYKQAFHAGQASKCLWLFSQK